MVIEKQTRRRGKKGNDRSRLDGSVKEGSNGASGYKPHLTPLISSADETSQLWYEWGRNVPGRDDTSCDLDPSLTGLQKSLLAKKYRSLADEIFRVEISLTGSGSSGIKARSDERWVENTMKKGTLKDRIAATSVLVSTDPIHKLSALDSLLGMAGCADSGQSNSRVAQMAAEALEDLFLNTLLPPGRKLLTLEQRPLALYELSSTKTLSPRVLLLWRFEEILKERYQSFLSGYLAATLRDGMDLNKTFALRIAGTMLRSTPEGEAQLLTMMVNKLGDPGRKIAASSGHELRRVLDEHEKMQEIVAREVQQLAHRPHLSPRALYNCIVFLNQLKLRKEGSDAEARGCSQSLAVSLVDTYFRMFDVAMRAQSDDKHGMKSRLLSALLTGINRARPFLPDRDQGLEEHIDSLYSVSHIAAPSASTQALMLLFHVAIGPPGETRSTEAQRSKQDRFYRALYAKLSKSSFLGGGKHLTLFFNLIYKTMKHDADSLRVVAFAKKLMCTVLHVNPAVAGSSLFLLNEVMKTHKHLAGSLNDIPVKESAYLRLDPSKREPRAAIVHTGGQAINTMGVVLPLWDVCLLSHHFHPSVAKFAASLGGIEYSGDPLRDFALAPFLDKFSYKNPKAHKKGTISVAQRRIKSQVVTPVNDPAFLKNHNVDDADKFFHNFFLERARRDDDRGFSRETDGDDGAEDEAFDLLEEDQIERVFDEEGSTDSEERAFVDKLAIGLLDEASGDSDANFDGEDPDMDDWEDASDNVNINSEGGALSEDGNVDIDSTGSDVASGHADGDGFMSDSDSYDQSDSFRNGEDDDDGYAGEARYPDSKKKSTRATEADLFADADEYADLINKGLGNMASGTNLRSKLKRKRKNGIS